MPRASLKFTSALVAATLLSGAAATADTYGPFPITVKGYEGDKTNSVAYSGQIARHVLHDSLKKLASKGDGGANAAEVEAALLSYFNGAEGDLEIIAPTSKGDFKIQQATVNEISKGKNISGKFYDGAMAYNQAVDNYLDEKLEADTKPNSKPYKDGAPYTGKEHVWDEAFGYFVAAAHSLGLSAEDNYNIAKKKDLAIADANGDGVVDLKTEFVFGPAYYAAGADKSGKTTYMTDIMTAFIEGRKLISSAQGEDLTDEQRAQLKAYAATIEANWEKVLAEATFKYAGSVYKDIKKIGDAVNEEERAKAYRAYVKHWGELKGFAMALQSGKNNLGRTAVHLNRLIGYGPVTMDETIVSGIDADGNFVRDRKLSWSSYQLNMLRVQELLLGTFGIEARANDATAELASLVDSLNTDGGAETD
ncbi:hypothetical protein TRL7639_04288 [Falsiruegeria litorea R37]|uniref:DUF4856 domain-containing protein n=1 Tax=Falsiruegeria litorea R37 TaxID=1200284 RepID=A0A1Y5TTK2_9RHOB|nr:DUF4856 domain-containing protein [Falsiruegeria litorea]SLN72173.1 hypothetical protein TRL7639_04288 [Falsiruegeria litorea R37]